MAKPIDRRSFLAGGLAVAGGSLLANELIGSGPAAAYSTNGHGLNGISTAKPRQGGSLTFGIDTEEQGFNPYTGRWDEGGFLYGRTVFDPLLAVTATGTLVPYLAQSITPNADYTSWTLTLRPNILFHDGTPFDAQAMNLNFEKGVSSPLTGPAFTNQIKDAHPTGGLTFVFDLVQPWVTFPYALADAQTAYPAAPSMLNAPNGGTDNPVGTGPFVFQSWVPNSHFTATRNPHYWRKGLPYLDSITFRPIIDSSARQSALQTGTIDIMHSVDPVNIRYFKGNKSWAYVDDSGYIVGEPSLNLYMLNTSKPPFNNVKARRAMAKALNLRGFSNIITYGVDTPVNGPFVPGSPYYVADSGFPSYDPAGAKRLVKEVEQETGKPFSFSLAAIPNATALRAAQYAQAQYQQAGMKVTIPVYSQAEVIDNALSGDFEATSWRQFGAIVPDENYIWWTPTLASGSLPLNFARNADPRLQPALIQGRSATTSSDRVQAYRKVSKLLNEDLPYMWLGRAVWSIAASPKVQDWYNPTAPGGQKLLGLDLGVTWPTQIWLK